ncbi:MAG: hypothetical protein ABIJ00_07070 [Candidatus Eisenbacteria bacterium]
MVLSRNDRGCIVRFASWVLLAVLTVVVGCGGGLDTTPKSVSLAYKDMGGEYVQYKSSTSIIYNVEGRVQSALHDIIYSVKVDSIAPDGAIDRRLKFDEFVMGELAGGRLELDPNASKYKGENLYLKLGPEGQLLDWKGLDGIRGYTISDQSLKDDIVQMMVEFFQPLGKEEVTVGSTWQRFIEIPVKRRGGEITQKATISYTVEGFGTKGDRPCVKIKTKVQLSGEGSGEISDGKKFWVEAEGKGEGELWFDYVDGLPVESSGTATITSDFSYERSGKEDVTSEYATIDVESKMKLVK